MVVGQFPFMQQEIQDQLQWMYACGFHNKYWWRCRYLKSHTFTADGGHAKLGWGI